MLELRVQQHFIDSADLNYQAAQTLAKPIADAIQAVLVCLTGGGKVLACGSGRSATLAQNLVTQLVTRHERERPELGAVALTSDGALMSALASDGGAEALLARPLRAMAQPGDLLLALSHDGQDAAVCAAVEAAHAREMVVVALTGGSGGRLGRMLRETDVHVCAPSERAARIHEIHLLTLHCIADGVDTQLLGEQENFS